MAESTILCRLTRIRDRLTRMPLWIMVVTMSVLLTGSIAFAATRPQRGRPAPPPIATSSPGSTPSAPPIPTTQPSPAPQLPQLDAVITSIENKRHVSLGIAIAPLSPIGQPLMKPYEGGTLRTGEAWATIDIPIALAVIREPKQPEDLNYLLNRAIIDSSTAGDDALWAFLGNDSEAAQKTMTVLRQAGDVFTDVPWTRTRPQYPPYTQTMWSNAAQAQFASAIYCMPDTWTVMTRMDDQPASAKWGLGRLPRTQFKSGSGLNTNGTVLVRQFGAATLQDGTRVGIGLSAVAIDGTEATAIAAVEDLIPQVHALAQGFRGHC